MLFVDVRGSTSMAERMGATEFSKLMRRFYAAATDVLVERDALLDKLVGDEVIGIFMPALAGAEPARQAVAAARELLQATGHGAAGGPWIDVGVGVHTGPAFFGTVTGTDGTFSDFTALGDNMNIAARLTSSAGPGEALISDAACAAAKLDLGEFEHRYLELKGKSEPVGVRVLRARTG